MATKKNIFRRVLDFVSAKQLKTDVVARNPAYNDDFFTGLGDGPESEIEKLLAQCSPADRDPMPREWMKLSRLLYNKIPIYKRAIELTAEFVGGITLADDAEISDRARDMVETFWREVKIFSEVQTRVSDNAGANGFARDLVKNCLLDGLSFAEERFVMLGDEVTDEYAGVMLFDADHFEYVANGNSGDLVLRYLANQFPQVDFDTGEATNNPYFHVLKIENDTRSPWGLPLAAGSEMIAKILTAMLLSIELQSKRFGNPPTMTTIAPLNPDKLDVEMKLSGSRISVGEAVIQSAKKLKEMIQQAWQLAHHGRAAEIVQGFPAPVEISSRILGEGMNTMVDPETLWKAAILMIEGLGVPPILLNISASGGGINSDMHRVAVQVFRSRVQSIREKLKPIIRRVTVNYLLQNGVNPADIDGLKLAFQDVDLQGPEQRAAVKKTEAEATSIIISNYEILSNYDPAVAADYARRNGFEIE